MGTAWAQGPRPCMWEQQRGSMPAPTSLVCSCLPSVHGSGGGVLRCSGVRLPSSGSRSTGRPSSALRFFSSSSSCRRFLREEAEAPQNENPAAGGGEVSGRAALGLGGAASSRSGVFLKGLARSVAVALVTRLTWALVCCRFLYWQRVQAPVKAWHSSLKIITLARPPLHSLLDAGRDEGREQHAADARKGNWHHPRAAGKGGRQG